MGFNKHPSSLLMFRILKLQIAVETSIHPQLLSFYKLTAWTDIPSGQRIIILNSETRVIQGPYKGHTRVIGLLDYHRRALSKTKSLKNGLFNGDDGVLREDVFGSLVWQKIDVTPGLGFGIFPG